MISNRRIFLAAVGLSIIMGQSSPAAEEFEELLRRVPRSANAIVLINVDRFLGSPLATAERWKSKREQAYVDKPIILPPEANRIVIAAQLDPLREMQEAWELAVMDLESEVSIRSIARAEGGYVDTINGLESVWTPSNAYFVKLESRQLGMMFPANRQYVSRWADFAKDNQEIKVSQHLKSAVESFSSTDQILMAIDMKDIVQRHKLSEGIQNATSIPDKKKSDESLADVLASVQGLVLNVNCDTKARGKLRVYFGKNVALIKPFAKPLLLEVMDKRGASIPDFEKWQITVGKQTLTLEGDLSKSGLRRVLSVLEMPSTKFSSLSETASQSPSAELTISTSKNYFKSVETLIKDLRREIRRQRARGRDGTSPSVWMERYARKIDRLPILNVDEELLAFGATVGESLREMAGARRSAKVRSGVRKSAVYGQYQGYGYGYGGVRTSGSVRRQIDAQELGRASQMRISVWENIENQLAANRKKMTKKYGVEF